VTLAERPRKNSQRPEKPPADQVAIVGVVDGSDMR
jgi:hypothetical protein